MSFLKRLSRAAGIVDAHAEVPIGTRVYAIGDIHGRLDLLEELLARFDSDFPRSSDVRSILVFLGDLVDRGPDSAGVVKRVLQLSSARPRDVHCLLGNHEEALLRVVDAESGWLARWLEFGGDTCAASYGVEPSKLTGMSAERGADLLRQAIPPKHISFLRSLQDSIAVGGYLFVHAGIRPGVPIAHQSHQDLRWIREPFLSDGKPHGVVVVHGHTVVDVPDDRGNRVGIDTGAYYSGRLTALVLEGTTRRYLVTGPTTDSRR